MARKTEQFTISAEGRDKGKLFLITEWPVTKIDDWSIKALLGLLASNVEIPEGALQLGTAYLVELGLQKLGALKPEIASPLLAELLECVKFIPNPAKTNIIRPLEVDIDIEEIETLWSLRMRIFGLHTSFFQAAGPSLLEKAKGLAGKKPPIPTSRKS